MTATDQKLTNSLSGKPEFLTSTDLIDLGLFGSFSDVCWANKRGFGPPSIRLGKRKIRYPKIMLVEWLTDAEKAAHR